MKIKIECRRQKEDIERVRKGQKFYKKYMGTSYNKKGDNVRIQNCPALKKDLSLLGGPSKGLDIPTTCYFRGSFHTSSFWNELYVLFLEKMRGSKLKIPEPCSPISWVHCPALFLILSGTESHISNPH